VKARKAWQAGRWVQVDECGEEGGFVVSLGRMSLWLKVEEAQDMVATLTRALLCAAVTPGEKEPDLGPEAVAVAIEEILEDSN
jgi:hypothetical protein